MTAELVAQYRHKSLAGEDRIDADGMPIPHVAKTVRLELALLDHLFTVALKEWGLGLAYNLVPIVRRPAPGPGRNRRLSPDEETKLFAAVDKHSNPLLRWIVRIVVETGMRSSGIVTLRLSQVDMSKRLERLIETKNTLPRTVPLLTEAISLLKEALANPARPKDVDLIFFGEPGKDEKHRPYNFSKGWMEIIGTSWCGGFRFHDY